MKTASPVTVRWPVLAAAALALLAAGAGATYVSLRPVAGTSDEPPASASSTRATAPAPGAGSAPSSVPPTSVALPDVLVPIGREAAERARITVTTVGSGTASGALRVPGVVAPNAYKQVVVTPLTAGRITRVAVELGQQVRRGETLAQMFSPDLAEAQVRYISARAELEAHDQELARTEKLVAIGAASNQELERIHAEHTTRRAGVQSAASRLQLLGVSGQALARLGPGTTLDSISTVPAPIAGVVTERQANSGLNVEPSTALFTVVDLSTVWVVADLYEKDFARVRVGATATVTTTAYPDLTLPGRVSYIDPQVDPDTRTAKVRIEVANNRGQLRLGMYAAALIGGDAAPATPMVPRTAVQNVADRTVVYLVNPKEAGMFIEREVQLGAAVGDQVTVRSGVTQGDVVVAEGSFSVRAERERLGLRAAAPATAAPATTAAAPAVPTGAGPGGGQVQEARVSVTASSFEPNRLTLRAGVPARVTFTRTSDKTCATQVVFAALDIRRELPLGKDVTIAFTPRTGELAFACGMDMLRGSVVIR